MAIIASASSVITYVVYRSATDPEVIIYADSDKKRPSIINLIIKNIGKGPASNISFHPNRQLPHQAFGIEIPDELPQKMSDGPVVVGAPYLAPGQELIITWGQYGGLKKYLSSSGIEVIVKYKRTKSIRPFAARLSSTCILDISQFEGTDSSNYNWGKQLVEAVSKTNAELSKLNKSIMAATEQGSVNTYEPSVCQGK